MDEQSVNFAPARLELPVPLASATGPRPGRVVGFRAGPPESALKVLLLHGVAITHATWRWVHPALAAVADTVALDLAGHGESTVPPGTAVTMRAQRDLVPRVLDALRWPAAVVVGHSMGGGAGLGAALTYPDRVAGLVQVAAVGGPQPRPREFLPLSLPGSGLLLCGATRLLQALGLGHLYGQWWSADPELAATYLAAHRRVAVCENIAQAVRDLRPEHYRDQMEHLADVRQPMLIVHGTHDGLVPVRVARALHGLLPQSELLLVEGGSHMLHEDPANGVVERITAFVAGLADRCGGSA